MCLISVSLHLFYFKKDFPKITKPRIFKIPLQIIDNQLVFNKTAVAHASFLLNEKGNVLNVFEIMQDFVRFFETR